MNNTKGDIFFNVTMSVSTDEGAQNISTLYENNTAFPPLAGAPMPPPPAPPTASTEVLVGISFLFCVIGVVGILGNLLVIIVIILDRKMRQSVTNIFIMNLAVADFLIMVIGIPENVQFMMNRGWLLGLTLCKTNRFILVVSLYVSILSLVSVCVERFVAIVYPIKAHILCGRKKIIFAVGIIWPIAIACGLPTVIFNDTPKVHPAVEVYFCRIVFPERDHHTIFHFTEFAMFYLIPVVIQVILYAMIGRRLYASTDELHTKFQMRPESKLKNNRTSDTIKARKDVVKMLFASVIVYIVCYAPPQILLFYNTFSPKPFQATWSFMVFGYVISYINSAANPVLYSIFSQNFRRNFKKFLCYPCLRHEYKRPHFSSFDSRSLTRKVSSSKTYTSRLMN